MGEQRTGYEVSLAISILTVVLLGGCATDPAQPGRSLAAMGQPVMARSEQIVLGVEDTLRIRHSQLNRTEYVCSNGQPLECHQMGHRAYCFCMRDRP